jgi:hypothetical protein
MIAGMTPTLDQTTYVMCSIAEAELTHELVDVSLAVFREREGVSLIIPQDVASSFKLPAAEPPLARITLEVYSSLEGVGLTAAVSGALALENIPCNMVAGFHHDHAFVPKVMADAAMRILIELQDSKRT